MESGQQQQEVRSASVAYRAAAIASVALILPEFV